VSTRVIYITDPACAASWGVEPMVRRLRAEFGDQLQFTYVMGGLAREWSAAEHADQMVNWLEHADRSRMPLDPLIWRTAPLKSSYPACMAMKAATDQGQAEPYLRALREGIFCERRKLDTPDALTDVAARTGLDVDRFKLDIASNHIVEQFGNDLEIARNQPEPVPLPTMYFTGHDGARHDVYGPAPYEDYRDAAIAAGAEPAAGRRLGPQQALARFGRMATREVEEVCGLKGPRAESELWQLALDFEVKPTRVLTGWLWEPAG
jgi:predicted DsbA family dithiol-disulfide isomerase